MTLKDKINEDLKAAMKRRDEAALRGIRAIKAAIILAETAPGHDATGDLSPETEIKILQKEVKQRRDSIDQFKAQNREDLAIKEQEELTVIEAYLPQSLSNEEVEAEIRNIVSEHGTTSLKDLGKIMKAANEKFAGRADNKLVSELAKKILEG